MPQTLFKASGITEDNAAAVKDAGSAVGGVKWVNVMSDKVVVTYEDNFDLDGFVNTIQGAVSGVTLTA